MNTETARSADFAKIIVVLMLLGAIAIMVMHFDDVKHCVDHATSDRQVVECSGG